MSDALGADKVNSVFEQPWWLDAVAPGKWHEIIIPGKNGESLGRMVYVEESLYGISYLGLPPLTQQMGPWFALPSNLKPVKALHKTKLVLDALIAQIAEEKNVDLAFHNSFQYILPFVWSGYHVIPSVSYVIEDLSDIDRVYGGMESKLRNLIKNARERYSVEDRVCCEEMISLVESTFAKQGRKSPLSRQLIQRIYDASEKHRARKLLGARDKETGNLVAVAFFLYDEHTCYYLLGGKDYSQKTDGSQELLIFEGIRFAASVSREFDFEGSMIPGIENFFRGFGGRPRIYFQVRRGSFVFMLLHWVKPYIKRILGYK